MKEIESTGKDIEQALAKGLAELDCKLDDVDVRIIAHPGIFSKARVRLTLADGKGGAPAASEIMRDLERRAKDAHGDKRGQRKGDGRASGDDRSRSSERRDNAGQKNADQASAARRQDKGQDKGRDGGVPSDGKRRQTQPSDRQGAQQTDGRQRPQPARPAEKQPKPRQTQPSPASGFRSDFRAELAAATGEKPSDGAGQRKPQEQPAKEGAERKPREQQAVKPSREVPPEKAAAAEEYLRKVVSLMGIEADIVGSTSDGEINIDLKTDDALVIGRKGETLDALEYLATLAAADGDRYYHVNLDCGEYRVRRNEAIRAEAIAAAEKAVATNRRVELEPMNSASRREVHAALGERDDVMTRSEGREPDRRVVIIPRTRGGNRGAGYGGKRGNNGNRNRKHRGGNGSGGGRPAPGDE